MVISYRIPNGHMRIEADTFFCQATKPKIKQMFRQLRESSPPQEAVDEIRTWLQRQISEEQDKKNETRLRDISAKFEKVFS